MKRIGLCLVVAMFCATMVGAAHFSDVPASHWSYEAIDKLASRGILQGYPNGTFKGEKVVDRYSLAMVVAKLLANVEQLIETGGSNLVTKADLHLLEKLIVEFADELALLGVKVTSIEDDMAVVKEDVAVIKRDVEGIKDYMAKGGMEKVKISGDMIVRHSNLIHRNDWALNSFSGAARPGSSNNSLTESQLRFRFTAQIDENISAMVRWVVFAKNSEDVNAAAASARRGTFGFNGIGNNSVADSAINIAHLNIKNMFRFGGDFTFGRVLYSSNHNLLVNNYLDVVKYTKKSGDVDVLFQAIYDRHTGSYHDQGQNVDFRPVWNLDLKTKWHDHQVYLGIFTQDEPNYANRRNVALNTPFNFALQNTIPTAAQLAAGTMAAQSSDNRWDVEFGSKGPIGKCGQWSYDLAFAYGKYTMDAVNDATTAANPYISPEMQGWMGHVAANWDSKKQWAAKISYTFADDESPGAVSIINDMRYVDFYESPTEDIGRGNQYFPRGLRNMSDLKLQAEYRPTNTKHYFRLAGDFLNELKKAPVNDMSRYLAGDGRKNAVPVANKTNTAYDKYNNLGVSDPSATVLTFEYRYQLTTNTRIRVGLTHFDFTGDAQKFNGAAQPKIGAGRGLNDDFDYQFFWTEIYSKF